MKRSIALFVFCLCTFASALPIQDHRLDIPSLQELATALDIPEGSDLIAATQKRWLRKTGQERWHMNELDSHERAVVLQWAASHGFFSPWKPLDQSYDKALILGATTSRMQIRLDYLKQLWEEGIRFHQIVWLTGERPLDQQADAFLDRCHTETDAARLLWEESELPEAMRELPVIFIAVPMHWEGSALKRPNTEDTILAWLQGAPKPCKALFVSDQPFCGYQFAVIKSSLPDEFPFDLVGPGVDLTSHPAAAAITLDAIARQLYQECH